MKTSIRLAATVGAALLFAAAAVQARVVTYNLDLNAENVNLWGGGPATTFDFTRFAGPEWNTGYQSVGKDWTVCFLIGCAGFAAELHGETRGRLGFEYGVRGTAGSLSIEYPVRASLNISDALITGQPFSITPTLDLALNGFDYWAPRGRNSLQRVNTGPPTLQSTGPSLQAHLDAIADIYVRLGGKLCAGVCPNPPDLVLDTGEQRLELLALNRNNDGAARALGMNLGSLPAQFPVTPFLSVSLDKPNLDTNSNASGGVDPATGMLTSRARDDVAGLTLNLTELIGTFVPLLKPVLGKKEYLGVGYNLLDATAGLTLDLAQELGFAQAEMVTHLEFSDPVRNVTTGVVGTGFDIPLGETQEFVVNARNIGMVPTFRFTGAGSNSTDLVLGGNVGVQALALSIDGIKLGPLVKEEASADFGTFNVWNAQGFAIPFDPVTVRPVNLEFEVPRVAQLGVDICQLAAFVGLPHCIDRFVRVRTDLCNVDDLAVNTDCSDAVTRGEIWSVDADCRTGSVFGVGCDPVFMGFTDLVASLVARHATLIDESGLGDLVFSNIDRFNLAAIAQGALRTDADARALLASLGEYPIFREFSAPPGAQVVPEPGGVLLLGTSLVLLARRVRAGGLRRAA